ncbi:MAG: 3-deoxy-D-manno-octulosonic acid transferase [Bdellovibrionales bacterium]
MNILIIFVYRLFLIPLLQFLALLLSPLNTKLYTGLKLRRWLIGYPYRNPQNFEYIWFHCSSGEFEYAKPVIREIKKQQPEQKILVTYFSPSVKESAERFPGVDLVVPSPIDSVFSVKAFLDCYKPKLMLVARTDIWLESLIQCKLRKIPSILFSATLSNSNSRLTNAFSRRFYSFAQSLFSSIYCVSHQDAALFKEMCPETKIEVAGDTRFEQCFHRLYNPIKDHNSYFDESKEYFIVGSSWEEDENVIVKIIEELTESMNVIIAPHEPSKSHLDNLTRAIELRGISPKLYSNFSNFSSKVTIVDKVGILADLYPHCRFAMIGGSFKSSVHSVMESLCAGCVTFVGPYHSNNREALEFASIDGPEPGLKLVTEITEPEQLLSNVQHFRSAVDLNSFRKNLIEECQKRVGTSKALINQISKF